MGTTNDQYPKKQQASEMTKITKPLESINFIGQSALAGQ